MPFLSERWAGRVREPSSNLMLFRHSGEASLTSPFFSLSNPVPLYSASISHPLPFSFSNLEAPQWYAHPFHLQAYSNLSLKLPKVCQKKSGWKKFNNRSSLVNMSKSGGQGPVSVDGQMGGLMTIKDVVVGFVEFVCLSVCWQNFIHWFS